MSNHPNYSDSIRTLMTLLARLPGVGSRSAERMAFYLLKASRQDALALADAIRNVKDHVIHCPICFNLTEKRGDGDPCSICLDPNRDHSLVCVVEQPKDLLQLEATGVYRGTYHVLLGRLAPLENISPDQLTIPQLLSRLKASQSGAGAPTGSPPEPPSAPDLEEPVPPAPANSQFPIPNSSLPVVPIRELILATNPTFEGDGTALYIQQEVAKLGIPITRLARGLPAGAQIEYANKAILADALSARTRV
jgi:recombination protein RecR